MLPPRVQQQNHRPLQQLPQYRNGYAAHSSPNNSNNHHVDGAANASFPSSTLSKSSNSSPPPFSLRGSPAILLVALCLVSVVLLSVLLLTLAYLLNADTSWSPFFSSLPRHLLFPPSLSFPLPGSFHPSYHRCDLLPNRYIARAPLSSDFDWTLAATCHRYTGEETNEQEISYYKETREDSVYFTVFHDYANTDTGYHAWCGADDNSGCYTVIHDNCESQIPDTAIVEDDAQLAEVIRQRYGPTSFELRIEGEELLTLPLVYIPPTHYTDYHYKLLNQSVRPSSLVLAAANPNAAKMIRGGNGITQRFLGGQRCLYSVNYSMSVTGYYHLKLYIMYADFESTSSRFGRKKWPRPQNGLMRTDQRHLLPSHMYLPPMTFEHPTTQQLQWSIPPHRPFAILDTPFEFRGKQWNLTVPLYSNPPLVGRWISRHHLRFHSIPDINAITSTVTTSSANINSTALVPAIQSQAWWSNSLSLKYYSQEKRALATFCQHLDITLYDFLPYTAQHTRFSFTHATHCFGGKRFAFIGDSQTRTLIGRFVSIFLGTEYKFKKQPFRGKNPHHQPVEWECAVVSIPQNERAVKATQVGGDTKFAFGLPQDTTDANATATTTAAASTTTTGDAVNMTITPLTSDQFELCYFPLGLFYWETGEMIASAIQSQEFTLIILNSGQHPLSSNWHAKRYAQMMAEMFADIEERLMLGMDASAGAMIEPHVLSVMSSSLSPPVAYSRSSMAAAAHMRLQSQLLWWNTLYLPRVLSGSYLEQGDGRTVHRTDLFNTVARGMMRVWNLSIVDTVNDGVLTFIDCSDGRGHEEWPVFDTIFYAVYRGMHNKLQCKL